MPHSVLQSPRTLLQPLQRRDQRLIVYGNANGAAEQFIASLVVHRLQGITRQPIDDSVGEATTIGGAEPFGGCGRGYQSAQAVGRCFRAVLRSEGATVWILKTFYDAGVEGALLGIFFDPALAEEAHRLGVGANFHTQFNRSEAHPLSGEFEADAIVESPHDGNIVGAQYCCRSPHYAGSGGVIAWCRYSSVGECAPAMQRHGDARGVRHRYRKGEIRDREIARAFSRRFRFTFSDVRIVEVDVPGLTAPMLSRVAYQNVPRPLFPLDADTKWSPPR